MIPVLLGSSRQFFPSLHQKDAGVADVSTADLAQTAETGSVGPTQWCNRDTLDTSSPESGTHPKQVLKWLS